MSPRRGVSRPVRTALVGCGAMATAVHVRALRRAPEVELVAVADPDPAARERGASIGRAAAEPGLDAVLARDDVEAVVVAAPSPLHAELGTAVLAAGRHLYLEKPVATDVGGARAVAEAATPGLVAVVGYNSRAHPLAIRARALVREGTIGAVLHVHATFTEPRAAAPPAWRTGEGGGVLLDLADHHVDLIGWLLDDPVTAARAEVRGHAEAILELRTVGGVAAHGFYGAGAARAHRLELSGERGSLRLDRYATRLELTTPRGELAAVRRRTPSSRRTPEAWRAKRLVRPAHDPSWERSLRAFARAVRGEKTDLATVAEGARSVELLLAATAEGASGGGG
ncbi:MAG TPA: Gfo/Idh/MocA family oxidoreductase [Solirubrobacteraceae bacterium]